MDGDYRFEDTGWGPGVIPITTISGNSGYPVTIMAAPGHNPIVRTIIVRNQSYINISGLTFINPDFTYPAQWQDMPAVVVDDPSIVIDKNEDLSTREPKFRAKYSTFFEIHDYFNTEYPAGISLDNAANIEIRDSEFSLYFAGIQASNGSSNIMVRDNSIHHCWFAVFSWRPTPSFRDSSIINNHVYQVMDGISIKEEAYNIVVEDNLVEYSAWLLIGFQSGVHDSVIRGNIAQYGGFYSEAMQYPGSTAINVHSSGANIVVERNFAAYQVDPTGNDGNGFAADLMLPGASIVFRNNIAYRNMGSGVTFTKSPGHMILNNTFVENGFNQDPDTRNGSGVRMARSEDIGQMIVNNIFYDNSISGIYTDETLGMQSEVDHNLYFSSGNQPFIRDSWQNGTNEYYTLSEIQNFTPWENNGVSGDPAFADASTQDFHLTSSSPAVDNGKTLSEVVNDYDSVSRPQGQAYDIGAFEFEDVLDTLAPAAPTGVNTTVGGFDVQVDWTANTEADLAGYHVYQAQQSGGPYTLLTPMPITAVVYSDQNLPEGTHYYVVTAVDNSGNESGQSVEVAGTITQSSFTVLWSADHETGDLSQWTGLWNSGDATSEASQEFAHTGQYSAKMTIDTSNGSSGARNAVNHINGERLPDEAYYSSWYYFPELVIPDGWWNLMQWKKATYPYGTGSDPMLSIGALNRNGNGPLFLYIYNKVGDDGTYDTAGSGRVAESPIDLPIGQWVHIEAYFRFSKQNDGQITVWQDGVEVMDLNNRQTEFDYQSENNLDRQWTCNNYAGSTIPTPQSIYLDDAVIQSSQLPEPPMGLTATVSGWDVMVDWAANSETDLAGYHVYRAQQSGGPYTLLTSTPITAIVFLDQTLSDGTYYYVVTAVDDIGNESGNSIEVSATVDTAPPPPSSDQFDIRVGASGDDAEEGISNGDVYSTSSDLELVYDGEDQEVGMRFSGVNIPITATITNAYIQFTAKGNSSGPVTLEISGEEAPDAPAFSNSNPLTTRNHTESRVTWAPPGWNNGDAGSAQRTPDISAVIQEVIEHDGDYAGDHLVIFINGSSTNIRRAWSQDGNSSAAPLLHVEYTTGSTNNPPDLNPVADQIMDENTTRSVPLAANDPDGNPLTLSLVSGPSFASVHDNGNGTGSLILSPGTNDGGSTYPVSVQASDGSLTDTESLSVTVNDAPSGTMTLEFISLAVEDGWVRESSEHSNVGGSNRSSSNGSSALRAGDHRKDRQYKFIVSFDTSALPDNAVVTDAELSLTRGGSSGTDPFTTHGVMYLDVNKGSLSGSNALQNSDFEATATHTQSVILAPQGGSGSVYTTPITESGINVLGRTQMRGYFSLDDNDDRGNDYAGFYSSDNGNASRHPKLTVTYVLP